MATTKTVNVNRFDAGITTIQRASTPEQFNSGARMVKHFDIYTNAKKMLPVRDWTSIVTDDEKNYGLKAIGGTSSPIYGIGKGLSNWYGRDWPYRIKLTLQTAQAPDTNKFSMVDLSIMPSDFWDNLGADPQEIRVTADDGVTIKPHNLWHVDTAARTGFMDVQTPIEDIYIYYGSSQAQIPTTGDLRENNAQRAYTSSSVDWVFHYENNVLNQVKLSEGGDDGGGDSTLVFSGGYLSRAFNPTTYIYSDAAEDLGRFGTSPDDFSVSFMLRIEQTPSGTEDLFGQNDWQIRINNSNQIVFVVDGQISLGTTISGTSLAVGQWYHIVCKYDAGDHYIYIDGVQTDFSNYNDGDVDWDPSYELSVGENAPSNNNAFSFCAVSGHRHGISDDQVTTIYNYLTNRTGFWSVGSEEELSSTTLTYGGVQLYTKTVGTAGWSEVLKSGQPVKHTTRYPVPAFVEANNYFLVSRDEDLSTGAAIIELAEATNNEVLNINTIHQSIDDDTMAVSAVAVDKTFRYTIFNDLQTLTSTNVFAAYGNVKSMHPYKTYLAIASNSRNKGALELWDLAGTDPTEFVDLGVGSAQIVGTAGSDLFVAINGYIDNTTNSAKRPVFEIKKYVGGGLAQTTHRLDIPANIDNHFSLFWEQPVSQIKTEIKNATLFWAKIPNSAAGTTFDQGLWAVGKNEQTGTLALSVYADTSDLGDLEFVHGFANQMFVIHGRDGSVSKLAETDSFTKTSSWESMIFDDGDQEQEKKLKGVQVDHDALDSGQTVSVYYRRNGDTTWTKILDSDTTSSLTKEAVNIQSSGDALPSFKEIEFKIESTGGGAAINGFNFKYETYNDLV